ncbi:uncharacterized protein THITE_2091161 [Thermothielavioides terrestris NRRL 8126]|uniref:Uncharacterized protein n=1 Tax=Thermothielavioides terrestris (strain ATCC 38088 / NRRL 8126) TaxID=578455 RepID=G2RA79_THETT|nr:uncharacterized protein THITE_2091161 [Thermothielavioides terrestris NRRL 8126]AEO69667.1 hypothetical protein THITE_2091161 [Thermothielavioides terrestris NRRL 8126]
MPPTEPPEYPGVDLPLRFLEQEGVAGVDFYRVGCFRGILGAESELLQVREVAMMILMDRLTDKPNWHVDVFDDAIVARWRDEALSQDERPMYREILDGKELPMPKRTRLISPEAFDYCIAELRDKAAYFGETGMIFTLNCQQNTAIKADSLGTEPEWHPWTNFMVQDLVHPSMYPFVYGRTRFIEDEVVGVTDAIDRWPGKGEVVPKDNGRPYDDGRQVKPTYWSKTYQWLPANLAFQEDGTVRFTSYINNLHPKKYPAIYTLVEKLIDKAIPAWDRALSGVAVDKRGRKQRRFCSVGTVCNHNDRNTIWEKFDADVLAASEAESGSVEYDKDELNEMLWNAGFDAEQINELEGARLFVEHKQGWARSRAERETKLAAYRAKRAQFVAELKWREIRDPILPQPLEYKPVTYEVSQTLRGRFGDSGLQVIVKMTSIELTPEKPDFRVHQGWHIDGQMNEHIVATALYYLDSENVTPSYLSLRMATNPDLKDLRSQREGDWDVHRACGRIFGTSLDSGPDARAVQPYGSIETREGRLLAFPNVFQQRLSSFSLRDRTKPGHHRVITLWLVDPHQRIISTANVPPQRFDWWAEAIFGSGPSATLGDMAPDLFQLLLEQGAAKAVKPTEELLKKLRCRLPAEIMEMIRREGILPDELMKDEEARRHRRALMKERSEFARKNRSDWDRAYDFYRRY